MKKQIVSIAAFLVAGISWSQDLHFSQVLQSPVLLNPGATGVYDGWERVTLHHRNQWLGANTQFMSTALAAEATFLKNPRKNTGYLGMGLSFFNDIGGDARFGNQAGAFTLSGVLPMGSSGQLSLGLQGGFGSRKGDMSRLLYESQWNGAGFDPTIVSGESDAMNTFSYADVSTGLFYQYDGSQSSFSRNNNMKLQVGAAVYHANAPQMHYRSGSSERLERKYVGMVNFAMDIPNTDWAFDAQVVQFVQGGHYETIFGGLVRKRFQDGTKITGYHQDAYFGFGTYVRMKDAIIPTFQLDFKGFRFGVSYDVILSHMRRSYGGGSIELSISYTNMYHALFKSRRGGGY